MANERTDQDEFKAGSISAEHRDMKRGGNPMISSFRTVSISMGMLLAFTVVPVKAATFVAWEVSGVPFGDTVNVRKFPSGNSQKQSAYPNGTVLQMTGKCTGGVNLFDISGQADWKQKQAVRYRWCQIWHDPAQNGNFVTGWVYGRYIEPY